MAGLDPVAPQRNAVDAADDGVPIGPWGTPENELGIRDSQKQKIKPWGHSGREERSLLRPKEED